MFHDGGHVRVQLLGLGCPLLAEGLAGCTSSPDPIRIAILVEDSQLFVASLRSRSVISSILSFEFNRTDEL